MNYHEPDMGSICFIHDVDLVSILRGFGARICPKKHSRCNLSGATALQDDLLLVIIRPAVGNESHKEHEDPAVESTDSAPDPFLVKNQVTEEDRSKDLRRIGHQTIQPPCTDSKYRAVVIIVFCVTYQEARRSQE